MKTTIIQTPTSEIRYQTAYSQGKRDAMQGKPCTKPFGRIARTIDTINPNASDFDADKVINFLKIILDQK